MSVRSVDLLSDKESRKLPSQHLDEVFFRAGIFSGIVMLVVMSACVFI